MPTMTQAELDAIMARNPHLRIQGEQHTPPPKLPPQTALTRDAFDSDLEYLYYQRRVVPALESGHITKLELHREFVIFEALTHNKKTYKARVYTPDFVLTWRDGSVEVVEVKGKQVKRIRPDYTLRVHAFLEKIVIPNGWRFYEVGESDV